MPQLLLDAAGRRRSPATMPGFHAGRPPRNKGVRYPADPPKVEEIVAVMRAAGDSIHGCRLRGLIVVLWRAGLRISEALALGEADLDPRRGSLLVRRGKGGRRREVGMGDNDATVTSDQSGKRGSGSEADAAARLLERLLADPAFRARVRRDPAGACREAGLDDLAREISLGGAHDMDTLDIRESKSPLAGVMMAAATEGIAIYQFSENVLPHLEELPQEVSQVLSRVDLPAIKGALDLSEGGGAGPVEPQHPLVDDDDQPLRDMLADAARAGIVPDVASEDAAPDRVDCSVFSRPAVYRGETVLMWDT